MIYKYAIGQEVYYKAPIKHMGARGTYRIVGTRPIESDNRVSYRIKSAAETFERTADESDLTLAGLNEINPAPISGRTGGMVNRYDKVGCGAETEPSDVVYVAYAHRQNRRSRILAVSRGGSTQHCRRHEGGGS